MGDLGLFIFFNLKIHNNYSPSIISPRYSMSPYLPNSYNPSKQTLNKTIKNQKGHKYKMELKYQ